MHTHKRAHHRTSQTLSTLRTPPKTTMPAPHLALNSSSIRASVASTSGRAVPPAAAAALRRRRVVAVAVRAQASPSPSPVPAAQPMLPPYNVLITGGTKGVGRALAEEFLAQGDAVVLCSRRDADVSQAVAELAGKHGAARVKGKACNVARPDEVAALARYAADELGSVDLWINNAGTNAYTYGPLVDSDAETLVSIVETNVLGVMLCCKEAISLMRSQPRGGHVLNMDGAGADGGATPRFAAYGATKRGLQQLGKSLRAELGMQGITNVGLHDLSPGMVTTELLMSGATTPAAKFFINALAEEPATVASYLVPRIRRVPQEARTLAGGVKGGQYIQFLTKPRAYGQILARVVTGARKNRFVAEE